MRSIGNVKIIEINSELHGRCVEISNSDIRLTVTVDFGPRIIEFGFCDGQNILCEKAPVTVNSIFGSWRLVGGHRFTHSPENVPRTYVPDNKPVKYEIFKNGIRLLQERERWTQMDKLMEIFMEPQKNEVRINHSLTNRGPWPVELSVWSITAMAPGGIEVIPQSLKDTGVLPSRNIVLWPYSSMADKRLRWFDKYITVEQDPGIQRSFKLGINNVDGWAAYINKHSIFVKKFEVDKDGKYPDMGASYETYVNESIIEMESLSPKVKLEYGKEAVHTEVWSILRAPEPGEISTEGLDEFVKKYIL